MTEQICQACGGTVLPPSVGGAKRGTCHCPSNLNPEEEITKKLRTKRDHGTGEDPKPVTYTLPEPETTQVEKTPKAPKPLDVVPEGPVKATKAGSKLSILIDRLGQQGGTTLTELSESLSASGSRVDVSGVRSWLGYDLRRVGLGCRQDGDRLFLVGEPLPHKEAGAKKAPIQIVKSQPKKRAAMTKERAKKARKEKA